jgi:translation initiation factor 1
LATKTTKKSILFLGTSNHGRSRFAEVLFNSVAGRMGLSWRASSRGLAVDSPTKNAVRMSPAAVAALESLKVRDLEAVARPPAPVTAGDLEQAATIIALNRTEHLPLLQERFPAWIDKVEFWEVDEPPQAFGVIERKVSGLVARLLGGKDQETTPPPEAAAASRREQAKKPVTLKVGRETAGRRGKGVTTVFDLPISDDEVHELAGLLKARCGTGGTVKDGRIEIQGDQRERIVVELEKLGYKVKRVGG